MLPGIQQADPELDFRLFRLIPGESSLSQFLQEPSPYKSLTMAKTSKMVPSVSRASRDPLWVTRKCLCRNHKLWTCFQNGRHIRLKVPNRALVLWMFRSPNWLLYISNIISWSRCHARTKRSPGWENILLRSHPESGNRPCGHFRNSSKSRKT